MVWYSSESSPWVSRSGVRFEKPFRALLDSLAGPLVQEKRVLELALMHLDPERDVIENVDVDGLDKCRCL